MKIFVSYARVDKPYCIRIIETLHAHDVWYDQRLYAGQDWWKEILRRLDWCEVFIYLLSPDSVASLYCRRELEIARRLKRQIIPVLINKDTVLPDKMRDWQYVDLSEKLTVENVATLLNSILVVERQQGTTGPAPASATLIDDSPVSKSSPVELLSSAVRALEKGNYDNAIVLLRQAQASGYQSRFVRLDNLLRMAESKVAERSQSREVEREYQHIVALFAFESTREMACEALAEFIREFGDYDPQGLQRLCDFNESIKARGDKNSKAADTRQDLEQLNSQSITMPQLEESREELSSRGFSSQVVKLPQTPGRGQGVASNHAIEARKVAPEETAAEEILPMLQWCDIPYGTVAISSLVGADEEFGEMIVQVDNFVMSMYPVTNAQFDIFAKAEDGYKNARWWDFSDHAMGWFKQGKGIAESRFAGDERPRENVNWYEASAFANWLGSLLKMKVALPTIAQWQRAAKGDDDRYFPWGDDYDEERCNTLESGLKMTTPVNRYHKGASPYGVYDMAGNLWEWTMNTAAAAEVGRDQRRAVAGGSFVSPCDRAQTSFRYYLEPRVRYSSIGIRLVGLP
ncbi:MAG: SUMF1/EgtB/PvdO family nonheme iron enzyme [Chloroflexota bacterium]|nr:SUMF1/EgtB/PvdO family nonheme iron enzyme [Chloroflexota bacterium]